MARVYMITEEEMLSLLESLELEALRKANLLGTKHDLLGQPIGDLHRAFHYVAVRWAQSIGFKGYRG